MIWESPSMTKFLIPNSKLRFKPSIEASNSIMLFDAFPIDLACLAIKVLLASWVTQPIPLFLGFPLYALSKFNFSQPIGGGSHLQFALACLSNLEYVIGGLIRFHMF